MVPKLRQLLIPRKTQKPVDQPDYGTDIRAIEAWAKEVAELIGTGSYASLTGAGQTTTPGSLEQRGGFFVSGTTTVPGTGGDSFRVDAFVGTVTILSEGGLIKIRNDDGAIEISTVDDGGGHNAAIALGVGTAGTASIGADVGTYIGTAGAPIGFFGTFPGVTIPNVTGSRGGNAALASLLTGLANLGLITDSTTP